MADDELSRMREALDVIREEMRVTMLEQPITGERRTYNDGFASGLAEAIRKIDALSTPTAVREVTEDDASCWRVRNGFESCEAPFCDCIEQNRRSDGLRSVEEE